MSYTNWDEFVTKTKKKKEKYKRVIVFLYCWFALQKANKSGEDPNMSEKQRNQNNNQVALSDVC